MYDPLNLYKGRYREFIESIMRGRPLNEYFEYSDRHHIVPRDDECRGKDDEDNLIYLTYREHFVAHQILSEENPNIRSLVYAAWRMCNGKYKVATPEEYDKIRREFIYTLKINMAGEGNPNYNTIVVNNGEHQIHIKSEELDLYEEKGYVLGALPKTEETRRNLSIALRGHEVDGIARQHLSEAQFKYLENHEHQRVGTTQSTEARARIAELASIRNKGEGNPMYGRRGKDNPNFGLKRS